MTVRVFSFIFLCIACFSFEAFAGEVKKISKGRALVSGELDEFYKNDIVYFVDDMGERAGSGTVYKVKGRKYYVRKNSGKFARGMTVSSTPPGSSGGFSLKKAFSGGQSGIIAHGGLALLKYYGVSPFIIGADYAFMRAQNMGFGLRAGFSNWSVSESASGITTKLSVTELSGAAEYIYRINNLEFTGGFRVGYALASFTTNLPISSDGLEDDSLFLAPFASAHFPIAAGMSIGGEIRSPYYLSGGSLLGDYYLLGSFMYKF